MKYKAVIFDADGVTIESSMFSKVLENDYGISPEVMKPFFSGLFQECMHGRADLKEELEKVIGDWGWKGSVDDMLRAWFDYENCPNTSVLQFVADVRARGIKCYLATNQEKYRGVYLRETMGFSKRFDELFISAEVGYKKKDPRFFQSVFETIKDQLGDSLEPSEIFFTDDERENVEAAKTFGLEAVVFTTLEDLKQRLAV